MLDDVITQIQQMWPGTKLVRGRPRHSESNGGVERLNRSLQEKLASWMLDNNSSRWSVGINFVKFWLNTQLHEGVESYPYKLEYGTGPRTGISSLPID